MAKLFPISVEIKFHVTNGETNGAATVGFSLGKLPTEEKMPAIIENLMKQLPDGFRLMSRHESMMYFLRQEKGYHGPNMALPALDPGDEWHDPATANTMSFDNDDEDEDEE
jgi:hypothetical protein